MPKDSEQFAEEYIQELIAAKQEIMEDEDGTRGLFTPKRKPTALPQYDQEADYRANWLEKNRGKYAYSFDKIPDVPMLANMPSEEKFTSDYLVRRGLSFASKLFSNEQLLKIKRLLDPYSSLDTYGELFQVLPRPTSLEFWRSDEAFAEQRLSGPNPMVIRRVMTWEEMPFEVGGKDALIPGQGESYGQALDEGGLYKADYSNLEFIGGVKGEKYVPAPKALFYWSTRDENAVLKSLMGYSKPGVFLPIAIMPHVGEPVLFQATANPEDWMIAKWCVQVADGNDHELRAHWCLTHMVMEPFAIATARQLAENHPLGVLLRPHFRFMMYNNEAAIVKLLSKGGWIEQLMGGKLEESIRIATDAYQKWDLNQHMFPNEIEARGMHDMDAISHYPFRDDGMMLWAAIKRFVKGYLRIYYAKRQDLENDAELQAWAAELADYNQGRIKGMPEKITGLDQLVDIVTTVIFTVGPQHSAVNFAQYDYMATVLNMPLGAYCPYEKNVGQSKFKDFSLKFLPPPARAQLQLKVAMLLSSFRYDQLGSYKKADFDDPKALAVIERFQQDLSVIEKKIVVTNMEREFPYQYLRPTQVLNSISI
ncbi:MAG: lipoxygenase [Bacteroidia bacterium]|nr:lipoxygenase [Bacteroidia bacterium]